VSRWLKAICKFDPPVETMVYDDVQGSIALCRDNMAEPMPFEQKPKRIIYRYTVEKLTNSQFSLLLDFW
jgi:hypothetical protein